PFRRRRRLCRGPAEAGQESSSFQRLSPDCVGPTLARLAGWFKRFLSPRPMSRLSPLPPRSAPPCLECSSSLSQTVPPSTSLLPDGSLAPVLSEELSCGVPWWRSSWAHLWPPPRY